MLTAFLCRRRAPSGTTAALAPTRRSSLKRRDSTRLQVRDATNAFYTYTASQPASQPANENRPERFLHDRWWRVIDIVLSSVRVILMAARRFLNYRWQSRLYACVAL